MIVDYIVSFCRFLNKNGYTISNDKISRFFSLIYSLNISFTNEKDILDLMKTVFCSNASQIQYLSEYFQEYISIYLKELQRDKEKEVLEKEQTKYRDNYTQMLNSKEDLLNKLDQEFSRKIEELKSEDTSDKKMISLKDRKFLEKNMENLQSINKENQLLTEILNKFEKNQNIDKMIDGFEKEAKWIVNKAEELLMSEKVEEFEKEQEFYQILKRTATKLKNSELTEKISKEEKKVEKERNKIEREIEKERKEYERVKNAIEDILKEEEKELQSKVVQKEIAKNHREQFIGRNAVQEKYSEEIFLKNFEKLNQEEKNQIIRYLKRNLLKFKTKMTRNIHSNEKLDLNMQATIQEACRTGGLPMNLIFNKPMKGKTNLVLVLDVSGSCSSASKMMLTFMYLLKDVFPRGCQAFAFVNKLYDISEIMESENVEKSVNKVLSVIPRKGVYSDYYHPLETLWKDYRKQITKDSIVIFMGDARNNKNATAEEFMKNIGHRVKKCLWLNTETVEKWDKADSIASVYEKYVKMYEVVNTAELINFIEEF